MIHPLPVAARPDDLNLAAAHVCPPNIADLAIVELGKSLGRLMSRFEVNLLRGNSERALHERH